LPSSSNPNFSRVKISGVSEYPLITLNVVAANMVGTARKKLNSAACLRVRPLAMPPMIVAAERDTPGMSAMHCQHPIHRARR
jgi:hypothetical protein